MNNQILQQMQSQFDSLAQKLITHGKGRQKEIEAFMLIRYACCLIAQNGDPEYGMPRGQITSLTKSNKNSKSLRTTVPSSVINQFGLMDAESTGMDGCKG